MVYFQIVFFDTGLGNYGAAMMAYRIPDVDEPDELVTQHSSRFNLPDLPDEEAAEEGKEGAGTADKPADSAEKPVDKPAEDDKKSTDDKKDKDDKKSKDDKK